MDQAAWGHGLLCPHRTLMGQFLWISPLLRLPASGRAGLVPRRAPPPVRHRAEGGMRLATPTGRLATIARTDLLGHKRHHGDSPTAGEDAAVLDADLG